MLGKSRSVIIFRLVAASNQLRTQLSNLQSSHHKTTSELSVLQTRLDSIEREKKELYEEAERLHQRSNKNIRKYHPEAHKVIELIPFL